MNEENSNKKNRYSDAELQEFKELLLKKLESAKSEIAYYQEQVKNLNDDPESKGVGTEYGIGTREKEYLNAQMLRQNQYLKHLEKALVRIESKTYGICRETKKLISKERLRVVPHATLSIEAKKARKFSKK